MGSYISLDIELNAIRDFLSKTLEGVDAEKAIICEREEAGEFRGLDEFSNALFDPVEREAIAIRAVLYEINALIEWELHHVALEAYHNSAKYAKTSKSFVDVSSLNEVSRIKLVSDLPFGEIYKLIEEYYEINLSDLPSFSQFQLIRQSVNAFKHRKGYKDFRRNVESKIGDKFQPTREDAYKAIDEARVFLRDLWKKLKE